MSDGKEYLALVTGEIQKRLEEVEESLEEGQKEIAGMHEYYWENYTEMDQYGYENFDNQQALFNQVNANQQTQKMRSRLKRMLDSPFFGRVDFVYEGEEEAERFYIGIGNFARRLGALPMVYDWRAPVSGLFYDYDKGEASYEAPGGLQTGEVTSKWQYKIREGKMLYEFESDIKIDDEILKQELGSNGDVQLKDIVRTIQKEQNAIIRNTKDKILVIQGAAGSGKTSVALHRIAYLLYHDRKNLKSSDVLILSPNGVFSDYISHILPELGEEQIQEMSFDLFAYKELKDTVEDIEDAYDQIERALNSLDKEEQARYHEKQSAAFAGEIEGFLAQLEDELMDFRRVEWKGITYTEEKFIDLFYFKFQDIPLLSRMDEVVESFIDEYETLKKRQISEEDREKLEQKCRSMYLTRDLYQIYSNFLESMGYEPLEDTDYQNRKLRYEDVYPMLYLKYRLFCNHSKRNIKHLVIDEMQDYSYLQYLILEQMFSCKMTILGDRAQTMDEEERDVMTFLPKIFGKQIRKIVSNKSYRNTVEIANYASSITGVTGLELLERHGKPVEERKVSDIQEALSLAVKEIDFAGKGYETAAVLAMTAADAKDAYKILKEQGLNVHYIDRNSSSFKKGLTVTTFYLAKGLEFDQVFVLSRGNGSSIYRQANYICATRALHELSVYML